MISPAGRWKLSWFTAGLGATVALSAIGCTEMNEDVGTSQVVAALDSTNGLGSVNGLSTANGLGSVNGLSTANGLGSVNGLSSTNGLMTTSAGRVQISYLVRCALPAGATLVKQDQTGASYTFQGALGMAPQWATGACDMNCQEIMTACLEAHVNTAGVHIPLWIVANNAAVGWGLDPMYPNQEATFFGNIFQAGAHGAPSTVAPAYYCAGPQVQLNAPAGRLGSVQVSPPYTNPLGSTYSLCNTTHCTAADSPYAEDGFKACLGWNNTVTVWRQNTSNPSGMGGASGSTGTGGAAGTGGATGLGGSSGTGGAGGAPGAGGASGTGGAAGSSGTGGSTGKVLPLPHGLRITA